MSASDRARLADELASAIRELAAVQDGYQRAGLLDSQDDRPIHQLLGGREQILDFARLVYLASGILRNVVTMSAGPGAESIRHLTVFGSANAGKSTCVNALTGSNSASVHHRAAHTRHPQGFFSPELKIESILASRPHGFAGFRRVPSDQLRPDQLDEYSLTPLDKTPLIPRTTIWDAPDCDSTTQAEYLAGLIEALTIADAVLYVTTAEGYAKDAILEWLVLLDGAGIPLVGCLNKAPRDPDRQAEIVAHTRIGLQQVAARRQRPAPSLEMTSLPWIEGSSINVTETLCDPAFGPASELRQHVGDCLDRSDPAERARRGLGFIGRQTSRLLAPARAELEAIQSWHSFIEGTMLRFQSSYEESCLDEEERFDAFRKASVRLLEMLNLPIPGLREFLSITRKTVTFPARLLLGLGKKAMGLSDAGADASSRRGRSLEARHQALLDTVLAYLVQQRTTERHHPLWDSLEARFRQCRLTIASRLDSGARQYEQLTKGRIEQTAQALYREMEKRPVVLHSLRAGRLGADVAAVALAIKSGGISVDDLVVAPALLAVIEGISQGSLQGYVQIEKRKLRDQLREDFRQVLREVYQPTFAELFENAKQEACLLELDPALIDSLPGKLHRLEQTWTKRGA